MDGVVALFGTPALARLADLVAMTQEWRPDVIVHEVLESAGSLLAARLGVPGVVHGIGPMFPFYAQLIGPAGAAIGEPGLWAQASSEQALDICPPSLQPDDGPPPWPDATPLRPSAGEPGQVPRRVADALAADKRVAYFTLGTVKNTETGDFRVGLTALEDVRRRGDRNDGPTNRSRGARIRTGERRRRGVRTQDAVLERADLLVSHSGSGTMLGGLVHGVPQVALPRGTDQPQNAALLARAGAGVIVAAG